jgi:hypothetical protein
VRRDTTGKEKVAPLPGKGSVDDAEDNSPKKRRSPLLKALYRASAVLKSLARAAKSFFEIIRNGRPTTTFTSSKVSQNPLN